MKLKRIMAMVLCVAMVLSTMNFNVFATESTEAAPTVSGTLSSSLVDLSVPAETFLSAEITGLNATESVVIKLYSGATQIATTTLKKTDYFTISPLGVKIILTGESSSWETVWAEDMPRADMVPDKMVLYVDGVEMNSANVPMTSTNGELAVNWAAVPGVNPAPAGALNAAYISASYNDSDISAVFGEATGVVATESFEVKLYSGENLVGTAALVDKDKILLNGKSQTITWHAALTDDGDGWWSTTWVNGALNINAIPDKAELRVDGEMVSTCDIELNSDNLKNPVFAAVTDDNGTVQSFVAATGFLNGTGANADSYDEALQTALNAGGNVTLLRDVKLNGTIKVSGANVTLEGSGHSISGNGALWFDNGTQNIKNVVFDTITTDENGVLQFNHAKANVTDCIFNNNSAKNCIAVDTNAGSTNNSDVTIEDCTFTANTCSSAVINIAAGTTVVKNSSITDNTAEIAVIYNSGNLTANGNEFGENTLNGENKNKAVILTGPYAEGEYTVSITENAFLDADYKAVYVEDWTEEHSAFSTNDLSGNYWIDGDKPVAGTEYIVENDDAVTLNNYYTEYTTDGTLGGLTPNNLVIEVSTKAELDAAIAAAKDGDTILLTSDLDYEGSRIDIDKAIILDLNDKTITTNGKFGVIKADGGCSIINGKIVYTGTNAVIKVWNAERIEDIEIEATNTSGATIGGIVIQENAAGVDTIKNVTIGGEGLTNGIETYNCGNAAEPVIGLMENVTIDANGTGMLISAPCGKATNCTINGDVSGIEIWIKGTYSAALNLVDCDVIGGKQAVYAHDEFTSNPSVVNNGTLSLTADTDTTFTGNGGEEITLTLARAENIEGVLADVKNNAVAKVNNTYYSTLENALAAAQDGDTITLIYEEGDEPIAMNGAVYGKTVTITGTATVDWSKGNLYVGRGGEGNGTVIFDGANLTSASDQASTGIHVSGREKDTDNKYNGTLEIKNSTIELDYLINRGTINVDSSTLTVKNGFGITGRPANETESGEDATATITLNNNAKVIVNNHNGMGLGQAAYILEGYGIMNVNSGSTFECTQSFLVTEKGTMNVNGGNVNVAGTLTNNGTINVSGDSALAATVNGDGWVYMDGVTLDADTKLYGAKVRFASGTNNIDGSVIDDGFFQVGVGAYNGVDANVDTTNGVIVNVKNAKIGSNGKTYAGWVGTGFYDTDAEKATAMTNAKYVLNIENSITEFGYLHVSNDGELNVNGNATEKAHYNNSDYSFYAGDFIINGTATFDATDVLALYTKVSCDNGTTKPGTLNIVNGTYYEAERHNGAVSGTNFTLYKTGVVNVKDAELYIGEYTTIAPDAVMNISGEVTARGAITNNGTISLITEDALLNADDSVKVSGTFESIGNVRGTIAKAADNAIFEITGGTYTQDDISDYVADGYKVVYQESTKLYYVFPDFTVEAIATPESAVAGNTITVEVKVTKGGKYTNASWVLKYDPTYVTYNGTDAKNYKISGIEYDGDPDNGNDEFDENTVLGTYTFTVNKDVAEGEAVFEIVSAEVHNYKMAIEFDGIAASTKNDSVQIGLKDGTGSIEAKELPYNGAEQRGNEVTSAPANARITYSTSETDFSNGTQLPPAFVKVGEHTYYAKIEVDGYAAKVIAGKLTITPISVKPSVEWSVAPESDRVGYTPVINGVLDETYTGTVTIINGKDAEGNDIVIETLNASDFAYDGHGRAVYTGGELEISGVTSGELTLTVKYTAGTDDNYAASEGTATVNVDKSTIDDTTENALEAAITGTDEITYDGETHYVTVDTSKLPEGWTASVAAHGGVKVYGDVNVVDVTFTDTTGKYNDYTATVMVKIVRREVTIYVNSATKANGQADSEASGWGYRTEPSIIGNDDLGEIKIVRAEGQTGEIEGNYTITATYTPNNNYIVKVVNGTLSITNAVYEVEVVDNYRNGNKIKYTDTKADYTVGTRMILVHTDADYAFFTYNGKKMYDVSDAGYAYFEHDYDTDTHTEGKKYQHVYAIVVEAEYGDEATEHIKDLYAGGVAYAGKDATASYAPVKVTYDADINDKDALHVNDYSAVKGVYNSIYDYDQYQISILKADYNKDKIVNTYDAELVKDEVIK